MPRKLSSQGPSPIPRPVVTKVEKLIDGHEFVPPDFFEYRSRSGAQVARTHSFRDEIDEAAEREARALRVQRDLSDADGRRFGRKGESADE